MVKYKRQSTVYKIDKISQSEKNTVKMTENMAMCETKETDSPRIQTCKTPQTQRHRKISSCSTPFKSQRQAGLIIKTFSPKIYSEIKIKGDFNSRDLYQFL